MLPLDRIHVFCFGASYAVALAFELLFQFRSRPIFHLLSLGFGAAGLFAQTVFVLVQPLVLASPFGSLILLGWILAVFYLYGTLHHRNVGWGLFILPLLLVLTVMASLSPRGQDGQIGFPLWQLFTTGGERFWGQLHGSLVLLAGVGISVGFIASIMYLVQSYRLKAKIPPGKGIKLLNLERLEGMNRRAVTLAFPLLTAGLLIGIALAVHGQESYMDWQNTKLLSVGGLWVVFAILLYVRHGRHASGRQVALWTIAAFALLVLSLASPIHPFVSGGLP